MCLHMHMWITKHTHDRRDRGHYINACVCECLHRATSRPHERGSNGECAEPLGREISAAIAWSKLYFGWYGVCVCVSMHLLFVRDFNVMRVYFRMLKRGARTLAARL